MTTFKGNGDLGGGRRGRELFVSVAGKIKTKMFRLKREQKDDPKLEFPLPQSTNLSPLVSLYPSGLKFSKLS